MTKDNKDKGLKHCSHHYKYSHQAQQEQISGIGAYIRTFDVVICTRCGDVKRQPTNKTY